MIAKALEIRDRATFIPVVAISMSAAGPGDEYLLRRAGYTCDDGPSLVMLASMEGGRRAFYDPYDWGDRTFTVAHDYIAKNFDKLRDGDVVDVQHILGETTQSKISERHEWAPAAPAAAESVS